MFSPDVERALYVCVEAHAGQVRKGPEGVPYCVHPMHVALMLSRWGQDSQVIVAGLLHDVVEDCDSWTVERVETEFGKRVASIVSELTEDKSKSWEERKRWAVEHAARMSPQAAAVKCVDKLHNLRTLLLQLRDATEPEEVWRRFTGGRERTIQMARELVEALVPRVDPKLGRSLQSALQALIDWDAERPAPVEARN